MGTGGVQVLLELHLIEMNSIFFSYKCKPSLNIYSLFPKFCFQLHYKQESKGAGDEHKAGVGGWEGLWRSTGKIKDRICRLFRTFRSMHDLRSFLEFIKF